jgi:hypothetical protein
MTEFGHQNLGSERPKVVIRECFDYYSDRLLGARIAAPERPKSNPEAANLMNQARLMLRTGNKQKAKELLQNVVDVYPHWRDGGDAGAVLDQLP